MTYSTKNVCKTCGGRGYVLKVTETDREFYGDDYEPQETLLDCPICNGRFGAKVNNIRESANIPQSFYDSKLSDFRWDVYRNESGSVIDLSKVKKCVYDFVDNFKEWQENGLGLYIWSKTRGSGKTYLASCICNEIVSKYAQYTKFISASELIELSQKKNVTEFGEDPIDYLANCKVLVIDDLGAKQCGTAWTQDLLFRILDNRMQKKFVTIFTSNIKITELDMDDRVADRIYAMCTPIHMPDCTIRAMKTDNERLAFLRKRGLLENVG